MIGTTLTCAFTQWSPGLGDNSPMGWLTVMVYLTAASVAGVAAWAQTGQEALFRRERRFWIFAAGVMLLLGLNKQLDFQSLLTMIARCNAQLTGWYDTRRQVQEVFILIVAAGGLAVVGLLALLLRGIMHRVWPALLGLGFVSAFVVIRAASFHHVDVLLSSYASGVKLNWLLELPGPFLVALIAVRRVRARSTR
jgi:hypothetical protein